MVLQYSGDPITSKYFHDCEMISQNTSTQILKVKNVYRHIVVSPKLVYMLKYHLMLYLMLSTIICCEFLFLMNNITCIKFLHFLCI
jgi:hypothetical protein